MNMKKVIIGILLILFFLSYGKTLRFIRNSINYVIYAQTEDEDDYDDYDDYDEESDDLSCCDSSDSETDSSSSSSDDASCSSEGNESNTNDYYYENESICEYRESKCENRLIYKCNRVGNWVLVLDCNYTDFDCALSPECGFDENNQLIEYCCVNK